MGNSINVETIKQLPTISVSLFFKKISKSDKLKNIAINRAVDRLVPNILKKGNTEKDNKGDFKKASPSKISNLPWWIKFLIWQVYNPSSVQAPLLPPAIFNAASEVRKGNCERR